MADPRTQVIVRRRLDPKTVQLWFPGNQEAVDYNNALATLGTAEASGRDYVPDSTFRSSGAVRMLSASSLSKGPEARPRFAGDAIERRSQFTPPRTITLDTKYDGAVSITVWNNYAVQIVSKTGNRRVVLGPQTALLEHGEILEVLTLSTGKPKTTDKLLPTVYLQAKHNRVSDILEVETKDMVVVKIKVSYRVDFDGDSDKWFNVDNYVKLLADHCRSLLRNAAKMYGIEEFHKRAIEIVRDTILGKSTEGKRPGLAFEENGMRVYDVEVLGVEIGDGKIAALLINTQHNSVQRAITVTEQEAELDSTRRIEKVKQEIAVIHAETGSKKSDLEKERLLKELDLELTRLSNAAKKMAEERAQALLDQEHQDTIQKSTLARDKAMVDQRLEQDKQRQALAIEKLKADVQAVVDRAKAFGPDVVAALSAFADKALLEKMFTSLSTLAVMEGKTGLEIAKTYFGDMPWLQEAFVKFANKNPSLPQVPKAQE